MSLLKIPLFSGSSILLTVFILNTCTTVVYVNFSKNSYQSFLSKRGAKVRIFIFIFQIFFEVFFSIYFFGSSFGTTSGHSLGSSNLIPRYIYFRIPQPLFHHVTTASLSIAGAKVLLYNIFSKCFHNFFLFIFYFTWLSVIYKCTFRRSFGFLSFSFISPF